MSFGSQHCPSDHWIADAASVKVIDMLSAEGVRQMALRKERHETALAQAAGASAPVVARGPDAEL